MGFSKDALIWCVEVEDRTRVDVGAGGILPCSGCTLRAAASPPWRLWRVVAVVASTTPSRRRRPAACRSPRGGCVLSLRICIFICFIIVFFCRSCTCRSCSGTRPRVYCRAEWGVGGESEHMPLDKPRPTPGDGHGPGGKHLARGAAGRAGRQGARRGGALGGGQAAAQPILPPCAVQPCRVQGRGRGAWRQHEPSGYHPSR